MISCRWSDIIKVQSQIKRKWGK